jgi:hypothetical protein
MSIWVSRLSLFFCGHLSKDRGPLLQDQKKAERLTPPLADEKEKEKKVAFQIAQCQPF